MMTYDVKIGNEILRGLSYSELIALPFLCAETFVRRSNSNWIKASDCVELTHISFNNSRDAQDDTQENVHDEEVHIPPPPQSLTNYRDITYHFPEMSNTEGVDMGEEIEDRIFIPTAEYFKCKQKRKAAIIGVCTLGLAALSFIGVVNTWRNNIFEGTSFMKSGGMAFVLKCLSFCFITALCAIPYFVYSVFALIYYSVRLYNLRH